MKRPIGIFDSGLGGLTVLRELARRFPDESFCYLGDIARLPYGSKSPETIRRYGLQILDFLVSQNVKALIIACNSASTVFLGEHTYKGLPLLNVVEPGAEAAVQAARDKKVAVLGTSATIRSHAYKTTLLKLDPEIQVWEKACPLLVPLVEEGMVQDPITQQILERYLGEIKSAQVKTVVLGCTHYPVLRPDLSKVLGEEAILVESGTVLAERIKGLIQKKELPQSESGPRKIRICITDITDHFERLAQQLMGELDYKLERVTL